MDVALKPHQRRSVQFLSHDLKRKRQCGVETWVETWLGKEKKKRKKSECQWCLNKQHDVCEQHHRSGFNPRLLHVFEQDSVIIQDFKDVLWSAGLICSLSLTMCDIYKWALLFLLMIHIQYALFMYLINESEVLYVFWAVFFFFPTRLCAFVCCVKNDGRSHLILGAFRDTSVCEYTTEPLCHLWLETTTGSHPRALAAVDSGLEGNPVCSPTAGAVCAADAPS